MTPGLKPLAALAEDPSSAPSTLEGSHLPLTPAPQDTNPVSACSHVHRHSHALITEHCHKGRSKKRQEISFSDVMFGTAHTEHGNVTCVYLSIIVRNV